MNYGPVFTKRKKQECLTTKSQPRSSSPPANGSFAAVRPTFPLRSPIGSASSELRLKVTSVLRRATAARSYAFTRALSSV